MVSIYSCSFKLIILIAFNIFHNLPKQCYNFSYPPLLVSIIFHSFSEQCINFSYHPMLVSNIALLFPNNAFIFHMLRSLALIFFIVFPNNAFFFFEQCIHLSYAWIPASNIFHSFLKQSINISCTILVSTIFHDFPEQCIDFLIFASTCMC